MYNLKPITTIALLSILAFSTDNSFAQEKAQAVNPKSTVVEAKSIKDLDDNIIPTVMKNKTQSSTIPVNQLNASISSGTKSLPMSRDFAAFPKGATIDLTLHNMDVSSILRIIAKEGGKNIVIDDSVHGTISAELKKISLNEAMQTILTSQELEARLEDNTIFVASRPAMAKKGLNRKFVKAFKLNNANAVDVAKILEASIFNKGYTVNDTSSDPSKAGSSSGKLMQAMATPEAGNISNQMQQGLVQQGVSNTPLANTSSSSISSTKKIRGRVEQMAAGQNFNDAGQPASSIKLQAVTSTIQDISINNNDGNAIVIPDTRTNSVLVAGLQEDIDLAGQTIKYLDKPLPQVSLEVSLIEVNKENEKDLGLSAYATNDKSSYTGFNNSSLSDPTNYANSAELSYSTIKSLTSGTTVRLRTLIKDKKVKVLANPTIVALDGSESLIKITDRIISKLDVTTTQSSVTYNTTLEDVGIVLNILPRIGDDGYVTMRIRPSITSPIDPPVSIGSAGNQAQITLVQTREVLLQDVRVKAGETLSIAGLIKDYQGSEQGKIPLIGDIPVVGKLFSNLTNSKKRNELVILITPKLISENQTL